MSRLTVYSCHVCLACMHGAPIRTQFKKKLKIRISHKDEGKQYTAFYWIVNTLENWNKLKSLFFALCSVVSIAGAIISFPLYLHGCWHGGNYVIGSVHITNKYGYDESPWEKYFLIRFCMDDNLQPLNKQYFKSISWNWFLYGNSCTENVTRSTPAVSSATSKIFLICTITTFKQFMHDNKFIENLIINKICLDSNCHRSIIFKWSYHFAEYQVK